MELNFDTPVNRVGTHSLKWDNLPVSTDGEPDGPLIPLWVADMDFPCPHQVIDALQKRVKHGIFGYTEVYAEYRNAVCGWMKRRHNWEIKPDWICVAPGVVPALNLLVRTFAGPGQKVLVQTPVYHPFYYVLDHNKTGCAANPLIDSGKRYEMDFEDLAKKAADPKVTLAILCNPHNPVGRVWNREELMRFGNICRDNNVLVISDDIHHDLIYSGTNFLPFASISEEFRNNSITCTAPSKTFNIAGLQNSNIIIPNPELRSRFLKTLKLNCISHANPLSLAATEAAYNQGEEWLDHLLKYLPGNIDYLEDYLNNNIPEISFYRPEGTYLVWADFRKLGFEQTALNDLLIKKAGVFLNDGIIFGKEGEGFQRINIGCPRIVLKEAIERIHKTLKKD
jgi:cystathionine beta-lyase